MNKESCVYVSFSDLGRLGRLGNQMFQYAALYALADKLNCNMITKMYLPYQEFPHTTF